LELKDEKDKLDELAAIKEKRKKDNPNDSGEEDEKVSCDMTKFEVLK
jgi:hypothetical protein